MNQTPFNSFQKEFSLTDEAQNQLIETTRWTKFLSILGFLFIALMLFGFFVLLFSRMYAQMPLFAKFGLTWYLLFSVAMMALYIYPVWMLFQFSVKIKQGILQKNEQLLVDGFRAQKKMFQFMGLVSILVLILYLVMIASSLFFAMD